MAYQCFLTAIMMFGADPMQPSLVVPRDGAGDGPGMPPSTFQTSSTIDRFAVADTLSHDVTIWDAKGNQVVKFGQNGVVAAPFDLVRSSSCSPPYQRMKPPER